MIAVEEVHVEDPAVVSSTDPEREIQESWKAFEGCDSVIVVADELRWCDFGNESLSAKSSRLCGRPDQDTWRGRGKTGSNPDGLRSRSQRTKKKRMTGGRPPFHPQLSSS